MNRRTARTIEGIGLAFSRSIAAAVGPMPEYAFGSRRRCGHKFILAASCDECARFLRERRYLRDAVVRVLL